MIASLTPRERQVYEALGAGGHRPIRAAAEVAALLGLTVSCVYAHLTAVRRKTGTRIFVPAGTNGRRGRPPGARNRPGRLVADGPRCACGLLLPCDHAQARAA